MQLDRLYEIESPERIRIQIPLAGLFSRFLAVFLDGIFLLVALFLLLSVLQLLLMFFVRFAGNLFTDLIFAATYLLLFLLQWGYFLFFEVRWKGQTPGKRILKIRTIRLDGGPIRFSQAALRNLLRPADALPVTIPLLQFLGYSLGASFCFFSKKRQRIGDILAGTLVVREIHFEKPMQIRTASASFFNSFREDAGLRRRLQQKLEKPEKEFLLDLALRADQLDLPVRFALMKNFSSYLEQRLRLVRPDFLSEEKFVLNLADALFADEEALTSSLSSRTSLHPTASKGTKRSSL